METIDVQNRSFVVRWLKVSKGDTVTFQLKPLKRSVEAGIYKRQTTINNEAFQRNGGISKRRGSSNNVNVNGDSIGSVHIAPDTKTLLDYALNRSNSSSEEFVQRNRSKSISAVQQSTQDIPLNKKLVAQGFTQVQWLGTIPGNKYVEGSVQADEDGYYAFVLDNTSSKTAKKKILLGVENKTKGPENMPVHRSRSQLLRVKQGRILQGYMLKKRRKKLQGFTKRFFKLDLKYKAFSYYLNEYNNVCRGEILIPLATVSANKMTRLIIIDSGMEIWVLKAKDEATWSEWIQALQDCFKKEEKKPTRNQNSMVDEAAPSSLISGLKLIEQKLEFCRIKSLSYSPPSHEITDLKISGLTSSVSPTNSAQSGAPPHSGSKSVSRERLPELQDSPDALGILPYEHKLYKSLGEVEDLVRQWLAYSTNAIHKNAPTESLSIFSDEFYDAQDDNLDNEIDESEAGEGVIMLNDEEGVNALLLSQKKNIEKTEDNDDDNSSRYDAKFVQKSVPAAPGGDLYPLPSDIKVTRRNDIPEAASTPPSLLSFLRKNVGKDLTSISMPITSNEPITILQMLSETFEYSELLTKAAKTADDVQRIALVAAFACSYLSMHRSKTRALRKPFNPLLGETFELVREDKGIRLVAEKVSHKPQIFAFHVDHAEWDISYSVSPVQKFWGKSIEFVNEGELRLTIKSSGERYEWSQPITILKNIFAGERYVEPQNHMEVISSHNVKARVAFKAGGMFSGRSEDLTIAIHRGSQHVESLKGNWTKEIVNAKEGSTIWEIGRLVPNHERKYGFTQFAANLNQITDIEKGQLPSTDSRLRPDLRMYEEGKISEAEKLKLELEQQQRVRRSENNDVRPQYFQRVSDNHWAVITGREGYWERRRHNDWKNVDSLW
ncbi:LADA_0B02212g1_1 [Lachancea dasiensis]|uniref:LADA_0B02212g1_1 n=1 Tax=Lachancea dasiensis TaxID=1072105 RepID=A0A1G4IS50_9SACH|nr:LADA_0B02212g1_1 [Lachancea dasiensis]